MIFNKSLPPPPYQSCTRSKMSFKATVINFKKGRGGGGGSVAHCIDLICVTLSLSYAMDIFFFESVLTFLQLLVTSYAVDKRK